MSIKRKYSIEHLSFPACDGLEWNAKVLVSIDGGENYYYCGIGKFCKTLESAEAFCKYYENTHAE